MNTSTPIFKFVTIRNPGDEVSRAEPEIQLTTALGKSIVGIIESDKGQPEKIKLINQQLDAFIKGGSFFKTKAEVVEALRRVAPARGGAARAEKTDGAKAAAADLKKAYENLYDNVVVRTVTKSTANEVFKLLTDNLKLLHRQLNAERLPPEAARKLRIVLPEGLVFSFTPPKPGPAPAAPAADGYAALREEIDALKGQQLRLRKSRGEVASQLAAEHEKLRLRLAGEESLQFQQGEAAQQRGAQAGRAEPKPPAERAETGPALRALAAEAERLKAAEREIDVRVAELSRQALSLIPPVRYALVGEKWVEVGRLEKVRPAKIEGDAISVYAHGCWLKFPFQVADLRVIEQETVGYVPGEIAHIHNTQPGELHEKFTERRKTVETFESLLTEDETFRETDNQSTQKLSVETAATEVQAEETSINVNASVSGTYGVVTASLDAGYSNSQSSQSSNSAAQSYAKEVVERVVERASSKVRRERSTRTVEEFTERFKHVIDNTKMTGPRCDVFRWLNKVIRAVLKNHGKRLIFQLPVAHPSHEFIGRAVREQPGVSLPPDPRGLLDAGGRRIFTPDDVSRTNYQAIAEYFNTKLEPPPPEDVIVSYVKSGGGGAQSHAESVALPGGYRAVRAHVETNLGSAGSPPTWNYLSVLVGRTAHERWVKGNPIPALQVFQLNDETRFLPVTIFTPFGQGFSLNVEIECKLEASAFLEWQTKCYFDALDAYDRWKAEAENAMNETSLTRPGIHPLKKKELIKTELKKGALGRMFHCNPFWITDDYDVGKVYDPDCCRDALNAEKIRFLETVFDWNNLTYELHPYLYADRDNWAGLLGLTDDDPHFEAFLQASFATVRVPVFRDPLKEVAAINFVMYNSFANPAVLPEGVMALLDDLNSGTPFEADEDGRPVREYDINGNEVAYYSTELGVFQVPTDLVILECGVENGVKPIGFPQKEAAATDFAIPRQYSPAIIADRCAPTADAPEEGEPEDFEEAVQIINALARRLKKP